MNNNIMPTEYLKNSFKGLLLLSVYWGIFYFIYKKVFKNKNLTLDHTLETIEFISIITIVLIIILFICKLIGNFIVGLFSALILLIIGCYYCDKLMTTYNISDKLINYSLLALGIIFNILLLYKIIINIRFYVLEKKLQLADRKDDFYENNNL